MEGRVKMTIIATPVYNDMESFKFSFMSLITSSKKVRETKIILLESGSTDGSKEYCDYLASVYDNVEVIHTPKEGPLKAYNRIFKIACDMKENLFLTQTDVSFPKLYKRDWLLELENIAKDEKVGMITCIDGSGISGADFIDGYPWVGAWFVYIPFRVIDKLGGYDDNIPIGWGVDIDYSYAVNKKLGLATVMINYWVEHHPNYIDRHEHEKREDIEDIKKEAFRYMREKWKIGEYSEDVKTNA